MFKVNDKVIVKSDNKLWDGKEGIIKKIPDNLNDNYIVKVTFTEGKETMQEFKEEELELKAENESLNESLTSKDDFIKQYVYEDCDDERVSHWCLLSVIATAENKMDCEVYDTAKKYGYPIYFVQAGTGTRTIVAAKDIKKSDIEEQYADFLLGPVTVEKLK